MVFLRYNLLALILSFNSILVFGATNFNLKVQLKEVIKSENQIYADLVYQINVDSIGSYVLPISFPLTGKECIVEPQSDDCILWMPFHNSESKNYLILKTLHKKSEITILFSDVKLQLIKTFDKESKKATKLQLKENNTNCPLFKTIDIEAIEITGKAVAYTIPESKVTHSTENKYIISNSNRLLIENDVIIYLDNIKRQIDLVIVLIIFGFILGAYPAFRYIKNLKTSIISLVISFFAIMAWNYVYWICLDTEQRFYDTSTIILLSSIIGLLFSVFISSIISLISCLQNKDDEGEMPALN